ncbi:MAG: TerB family tellurite resistance protein [Gammaproteobacteria bacterium]
MLLDALKRLLTSEESVGPDQADIRQAVAALLIHASRIDDDVDPEEITARDRLLKQKFDMSDAELSILVMEAENAVAESADLYSFTREVKEHYDREHRGRIVEMLWEVVLADGTIDPHEANLVWRVAGLLGFTTRENGDFRRAVQDRLGTG